MERRSSKEYSVVFLVEGKKFKLLNLPSTTSSLFSVLLPTSVGTTLEFTAFGSGPEAKPSRASAFWFFLSTTMVFAAVRTHFPKKNTRVYRNTVTCVTRVTSNRVEVHRLNSQHLAMVRTSNMAELVPSGIFCLQPWFLQLGPNTFAEGKLPVFMSIQLQSIHNCLSIKMTFPTRQLSRQLCSD